MSGESGFPAEPGMSAARARHPAAGWRKDDTRLRDAVAARLRSSGHPWPDDAAALLAWRGREGLDRSTFATRHSMDVRLVESVEDGRELSWWGRETWTAEDTPLPVLASMTAADGAAVVAPDPGRRRRGTARMGLDSPADVERYRVRYSAHRQATFDAYVDVFFRGEAHDFPGGWTNFSRCASAEPERAREVPALVARAEDIMKRAGYEPDDSGRPAKGRRWVRPGR